MGVEVAWLDYPSVAPQSLCFFSGNISAPQFAENTTNYFIDGVAINGVSGGPVFLLDDDSNEPLIIGAISAYVPNVATGKTLPGLAFAQGLAYFHDTIARIKSLDEAREQQQQQESQNNPSLGALVAPDGDHDGYAS